VTSSDANAAGEAVPDGASVPQSPSDTRSSLIAWAVVVGAAFLALVLGIAIVRRLLSSPEQEAGGDRAATPVVVTRLEPGTVVDKIRLPGVVSAWEEVTVAAQVGGAVVSLEVHEGDEVAKGDVLCRLDDRDYKAALDKESASFDRARAARDLADLQLGRVRRLKADGVTGQAEYDSADAAFRQAAATVSQAKAAVAQAALALERTVVVAPMAGTISGVPAKVGALIPPGGPVARIVDIRKVKVAVGIPERDVAAAEKLKEVTLTLNAVPGKVFRGRRTYLGVEPQKGSRTFRLELAVDNAGRRIRPGMFATAEVVRGVYPDAIVIPLFSVIPREKDKVVFVEEDGVARRRVVETGLMMGSSIEKARVMVNGGLAAGERLIVVGHRRVEDGQRVKPGPAPEALQKVIQ
jgi:membrane fusion protein (multidrug efflux system)